MDHADRFINHTSFSLLHSKTVGGGGGGVQAHLGPWPRDFWPMVMGLSGPKWAYIFFIVSLAWSCDETNFKGVPKEWPESRGGEMNIHKCSPQGGGWLGMGG